MMMVCYLKLKHGQRISRVLSYSYSLKKVIYFHKRCNNQSSSVLSGPMKLHSKLSVSGSTRSALIFLITYCWQYIQVWHNISPGNADNGSFNRIRKSFAMFFASAGFNLCLMSYVLTECWDRRCDAAARWLAGALQTHSRPAWPHGSGSRDRGRAQTRARRQGKNKT